MSVNAGATVTRMRSRTAVSADGQVPIGANGLILLREPASLPFAPAL